MPDIVRVLLVEDTAEDAAMTRGLLARTEYFEVQWVDSYERGSAALQSDAVDVCLIDYHLGDRSGLDLMREMQSNGVFVPMILLTGRGAHTVDVEAMKAGAADYLEKTGLDASQLERTIRYALQRVRMTQAIEQARIRTDDAKRKLERSFEDTLSVLDRANIATLVTDAEGTITFASSACAELLGRLTTEMVGTRWLDLFPKDRHDELLSNPTRSVGQKPPTVTLGYLAPGGNERAIELERAADPRDPQRQIIILRDRSTITSRSGAKPSAELGPLSRLRIPITAKVLALLVGLATIAGGVIASKLINLFTEDKEVFAQDMSTEFAASTTSSLDLLLTPIPKQLLGVAANFEVAEEPAQALRTYLLTNPECVHLGVYDASQNKLASVYRRGPLDAAGVDAQAFLAEREALSEPRSSLITQRLSIRNATTSAKFPTYSIAVPFPSARYGGELVIRAEYSASRLTRLVARAPGSSIYVVDRLGELFAHSSPEAMAARQVAGRSEVVSRLLDRAEQGGAGTTTFEHPDEGTLLLSYSRLDTGGLTTIVERPRRVALQTVEKATRQSILWAALIVAIASVIAVLVSRMLTGRLLDLRQAAMSIERGDFDVDVRPRANDELGDLARSFNMAAAGLKERAQLTQRVQEERSARSKLERYHSPGVVEMIIKGRASDDELSMQKRDVSVSFADLVGFTSMSESLPPDELGRTLNQFFTEMTECIFRHEGTLDKYIGDCIMSVFGAPVPQADHALRCVRAALEMHRAMDRFNRERGGELTLDLRTAINSGPVVAGDIGSPKRKDYTVLGDTVNAAARLESSVAKPGQIVIGEATYEFVKDYVEVRNLGEHALRGKSLGMTVYEVLREKPGAFDATEPPVS